MRELPPQIRLAAGDYFMHAQDRQLRKLGLPGNVCRIAVRMRGGLPLRSIQERLLSSPALRWLAGDHIERRRISLRPVWRNRASPPPFCFEHDLCSTVANGADKLPPAVLQRDLDSAQGPPLALDLVHYGEDVRDLVLSWNHTVMDARGAELLLRHINAPDPAQDASFVESLIDPAQRQASFAGWWENVKKARGSLKWLHASGAEPLFSLLPKNARAGRCAAGHRVLYFTAEETRRIGERCQRANASFRRSLFYAAASVRAVHALAVARGNRDGAYLVPMPHDMRRKGASGPIFSNYLSILFYRIEPRAAGKLTSIISELTSQMMEQIRTRFPESCMAALDMFKPLPLDYYARHLGKPTGGKFATFCLSDSGETCAGVQEFLGGQVERVTHLVPTWRPPGLTILFWSFRGCLCASLSWVEDCLTAAEAASLEHGLRFSLLEEEIE